MFARLLIGIKVFEYFHLTVLHAFYKHIKFEDYARILLKVTMNIA